MKTRGSLTYIYGRFGAIALALIIGSLIGFGLARAAVEPNGPFPLFEAPSPPRSSSPLLTVDRIEGGWAVVEDPLGRTLLLPVTLPPFDRLSEGSLFRLALRLEERNRLRRLETCRRLQLRLLLRNRDR